MTYPSPHPMWALGTGCDPSYHCDGVPGRAVSSKTGFPGQVLSPPSAPALCTCPPHHGLLRRGWRTLGSLLQTSRCSSRTLTP